MPLIPQGFVEKKKRLYFERGVETEYTLIVAEFFERPHPAALHTSQIAFTIAG